MTPRSSKHHQYSPLWQLRRFLNVQFLSHKHPGRFSSQYFHPRLPQSSRLTRPLARRSRYKLHKLRLRPTATTRVTIQISSRLRQSRYCPARRLYLRRNPEHGTWQHPTSCSRMLHFRIQLTSGSKISIQSQQKILLRQ